MIPDTSGPHRLLTYYENPGLSALLEFHSGLGKKNIEECRFENLTDSPSKLNGYLEKE